MADWKDIARNVTPVLAGFLPPPFNGLAALAAKTALGLPEDATDGQLDKAMATATPEQIQALKQAENDFKLQMERIGVDLEKIAAQDRDSARKREVDTKDKAPAVLAAVVVICAFAVFYSVLTGEIPLTGEQGLMVGTVVGAVAGYVTQVLNYYFGSSAGSRQKTELLGKK